MENQLVIFTLENEQYGVDIRAVESIITMQNITHMPHAPSFMEGVINLRGKILPVIDLRQRFNLPYREVTREARIVVVSMGSAEVGMVVDSVSEVLTFQDEDIEPTPALAVTNGSRLIAGIAKVAGQLVVLLDLAAVLSWHEVLALESLPIGV